RVLDDGVHIEWREQAAVAERPVWTAKPGAGDPNDAAQDDEGVGHERGRDAQRPEGLHPEATYGRQPQLHRGAGREPDARCEPAGHRLSCEAVVATWSPIPAYCLPRDPRTPAGRPLCSS